MFPVSPVLGPARPLQGWAPQPVVRQWGLGWRAGRGPPPPLGAQNSSAGKTGTGRSVCHSRRFSGNQESGQRDPSPPQPNVEPGRASPASARGGHHSRSSAVRGGSWGLSSVATSPRAKDLVLRASVCLSVRKHVAPTRPRFMSAPLTAIHPPRPHPPPGPRPASLLPFIPDGKARLGNRDLEQMSVSSQGAGKAATSPRDRTDCRPLHCPSPRSPKETLVQRPPTLPFPSRAIKGRGRGQQGGGGASGGGLRTRSRGSPPTSPDHRASAGNMVTTPDPVFLCYHAIRGSAWSKPKSNGAKHGPTWPVFLNPFRGDAPQRKLSPGLLSAE